MVERIGRLVQMTKTYSRNTHGKVIDEYFNENRNSECAVILDDEKPVGIVTRNEYYQKIGSQFGYTIYMTRPVSLIMDQSLLSVEAAADVNEVVLLALKREQANLYDPVVVTENGVFKGIVSIRLFLIELTRQREKEIELLVWQQEILKKANEAETRHRLMMEEKNRLLGSKNLAIRNLLDNAGQGFLSFGEDLAISDEYSYECIKIFEVPVEGTNFLELIDGYVDREQEDIMKEVFRSVFAGAPRPQAGAYLSLLPGEMKIRGKNILADYKIIPDKAGPRVMLILTDITDRKELELKMARERENLKLVVRAISNGNEVAAAVRNMRRFFRSGAKDIINGGGSPGDKLFEIYRTVHTFKGDMSQLCLYNTANGLHSLEDVLSGMTAHMGGVDDGALTRCMDGVDCGALLESDLKIITDALGEAYLERGETYAVSRERILDIERKIADRTPREVRELVLPLVRNLRYTCLKDIVRRYDDYLKTIAGNSGKCIGDMIITGDDVCVDRSNYSGFIGAFVHIFKNIVDHGLETMEERFAAGKPKEGKIECEFRRTGEKEFFIYVRDDGKGVDPARIVKKLREIKPAAAKEGFEPSMDELQEILFTDGFTTKESAGIISGRGLGLGAVRSEVRKLGGTIGMTTVPGRGTEFTIRLPII